MLFRPTCASLFAGGGGWEVGALQLGFQPLWAVEFSRDIAAIHACNLPGKVYPLSVEHPGLVAHLAQRYGELDALFASPPCQASTRLRKSQTCQNERCDANVGLAVIDYVRALRPRLLLLENVPEYQQEPVFPRLVAGLRAIPGYEGLTWESVAVSRAGLATSRRRLVMRAVRGKLAPPLPPDRPIIPWPEQLADVLPRLPRGELIASQLRFLNTLPPSRKDFPLFIYGANATSQGGVEKGWQGARGLLPTMVASWKVLDYHRIIDRSGSIRRWTPRASLAAQGFPGWYKLPPRSMECAVEGSEEDFMHLGHRVAGNAVPPPLASWVLSNLV